MFPELRKASVRSLVILCFVISGCGLAVIDKNFRPAFGDFVKMAITGYFAQLKPHS